MATEAGRNYFDLFGLPVSYEIDPNVLSHRYRDLQRQVHPDKFVSGTGAERRASLQLTTLVNEAFQTLRDPVRRAHYMLELAGVDASQDTDRSMDPEFLIEQMELREALSELRSLDEPRKKLAEFSNDTAKRMQQKITQFRSRYASEPAQALRTLREMQFLDKLRREIEELEEELT